MSYDQIKIANAIAQLTEDGQRRHKEALDEGYRDCVCRECQTVFLAFHHFFRCRNTTCPMVARNPDGSRKGTLLEQWVVQIEQELTGREEA